MRLVVRMTPSISASPLGASASCAIRPPETAPSAPRRSWPNRLHSRRLAPTRLDQRLQLPLPGHSVNLDRGSTLDVEVGIHREVDAERVAEPQEIGHRRRVAFL